MEMELSPSIHVPYSWHRSVFLAALQVNGITKTATYGSSAEKKVAIFLRYRSHFVCCQPWCEMPPKFQRLNRGDCRTKPATCNRAFLASVACLSDSNSTKAMSLRPGTRRTSLKPGNLRKEMEGTSEHGEVWDTEIQTNAPSILFPPPPPPQYTYPPISEDWGCSSSWSLEVVY